MTTRRMYCYILGAIWLQYVNQSKVFGLSRVAWSKSPAHPLLIDPLLRGCLPPPDTSDCERKLS